MNALGQYNQYLLGNGCHNEKTFYVFGRLTQSKVGNNYSDFDNIQNINNNWSLTDENLYGREEIRGHTTHSETFDYDNLNRLTSTQVTGQAAITMTYETNGNIATKGDLGDYVYSTPPPMRYSRLCAATYPIYRSKTFHIPLSIKPAQ